MMAEYTLIKMQRWSPLHIGKGITENYAFSAPALESDALTAALAATRAAQGATADVEAFMASFRVSTAFPYSAGRYFLPRPLGRLDVRLTDMEEDLSRKRLKSIRYVELPLWQRLLAGERLDVTAAQLQGGYLVAREKADAFALPSSTAVNQRVAVSAEGSEDPTPFFFEWQFFQPQAGLFCLLQAEESRKEELVRLFRELGENGVGTDKSIGGGQFEVAVETLTLQTPAAADASLLLSSYIPTKSELPRLDLEHSVYDMVLRNGYMAGSTHEDLRHLKKKSVYMLACGSVLHTSEALEGAIVDVRPEWNDARMHPVYRSGKPIVIPCKCLHDE